MKIPKRFKLLGQTIKVEQAPGLHYTDSSHGESRYRENRIVLQAHNDGVPAPADFHEHTFCHELVHFLLYWAAEDAYDPPLHQRECFVERLAGLLLQALTTMEYE